MPQGHHGRKTRIAAPDNTLDAAESATSTYKTTFSATDVVMGHSGGYEGALDQLEYSYLGRHKKIVIKYTQK